MTKVSAQALESPQAAQAWSSSSAGKPGSAVKSAVRNLGSHFLSCFSPHARRALAEPSTPLSTVASNLYSTFAGRSGPIGNEITLDLGRPDALKVIDQIVKQLTPKSWVKGKMKIVLTGSLQDADKYLQLQTKIMKKIAPEGLRPIVHVKLSEKLPAGAHVAEQHTVGIIGGTGPMSDASILNEAVEQFLKDNSTQPGVQRVIDLISLPPPRFEGVRKLANLKKGLGHYIAEMHGYFEKTKAGNFYLASNTAHLHIDTVAALHMLAIKNMNTTAPSQSKPSLCQVFNLSRKLSRSSNSMAVINAVDLTVDGVKNTIACSGGQRDHVLLLTTKQSWKKGLYSSKFEAKGVKTVKPDLNQIDTLQETVEVAKGNRGEKVNKQEACSQFLSTVDSMIKQAKNEGKNVHSILLGCTDFKLLSDSTPLDEILSNYLKEKHPNQEFEVVDTDERYATFIADHLRSSRSSSTSLPDIDSTVPSRVASPSPFV